MEEAAKQVSDDNSSMWRRKIVEEYLNNKLGALPGLRPSYRRQLELIADGYIKTKDAAVASGLSTATVMQVRKQLYSLLNVSSRDEIVQHLLAIALKHLQRQS